MIRISALALALVLLPADGAQQVTQSGRGAYEASLTATREGFAIAWYVTRDGHPEIYLRLLDRRGGPAGPERRLTNQADRAYEADIAAIGDAFAVTWYEVSGNRTSHAMLGLFTRDGRCLWSTSLASPERISKNPVVRTAGQDIFVAWLARMPLGTSKCTPPGSTRTAV